MSIGERNTKANEILRKALAEIRALGLAPKFKWGKNEEGKPYKLAVNLDDFAGFHELPPGSNGYPA